VIFSEFFELSVERFANIAWVRSATPRPMRLSARWVGGRDRNFELCSSGEMQNTIVPLVIVLLN